MLFLATINGGISQAQITPDGKITTVVENLGNMDKITGGERVGNNLFHSFEEFSIPAGRSAVFENAADIQNIFTRITGNEASLIDGLLKTAGGANFFLLNPNGVVFGENARLDLGGSFVATTADSIVFADGTRFAINPPNQKPLLTINFPIGLDFLSNNGTITVNGSGNQITSDSSLSPVKFSEKPTGISVNKDQTFALVGNGINFNGGVITTETGQIYLNSLESGLVDINETESGINLVDNNVTKYQDINITQQSLIDTGNEGKGTIFLIGKNINLNTSSSVLSQNKSHLADSSINIKADETLSVIGQETGISSNIRSETFGTGKGANISISANQLMLESARIRTNSFSEGLGGDINMDISDSIQLSISGIIATTFAEGNGGNINLSTFDIKLNSAVITSSTFGEGNGGNLNLNADFIEIFGTSLTDRASIATTSFGNGNTGNLILDTKQLAIQDGASVSSSSFGNGDAGNLNISSSESIEVGGVSDNSFLSNNPQSTIRSAVQTVSPQGRKALGLPEIPTGNAGNLTINTPVLNVIQGGTITVENQGTGSAGILKITAENLNLDEAGSISAAASSGLGGNILLNTDSLNISNDSQINATADGNENGGNITINTDNLTTKKTLK
ncbi:MAG: filamentous hemagglutinin N-terminal domain-containing protein [Xenococcaceae cyanobacterium MO_207.B15]|nr:filamentous hemagglutinin N-terminal domain-containing protein [Xenococcaceae cyanobacterium MO_207.B15]